MMMECRDNCPSLPCSACVLTEGWQIADRRSPERCILGSTCCLCWCGVGICKAFSRGCRTVRQRACCHQPSPLRFFVECRVEQANDVCRHGDGCERKRSGRPRRERAPTATHPPTSTDTSVTAVFPAPFPPLSLPLSLARSSLD